MCVTYALITKNCRRQSKMVNHKLEYVSCVVPGCENTSFSCADKSFFLLSAQEERYQHWLLVCKREDLLEKASSLNQFAVCSDHFIGDHFVNKAHTKLKDNAVPTIFPSSQQTPQSSPESTTEDNVVFIKTEDIVLVNSDDDHDDDDNDDDDDEDEDDNYYEQEYSIDDCEDVKDVQHLCRLCAKVADEVVYLFNSSEENLNLATKINASLPVTVHDTDPLPKQLCSLCVIKVNMCHEFAEMCVIAEEKLLLLMNANAFQSQRLAGEFKTVPDIVTSELGQNFSSITVVEGGSDCNHDKNNLNEDISSSVNNVGCILNSCNRIVEENVGHEINSSVLFSCPLCPEGTVSIRNNESLKEEDAQTFIDDESTETFLQIDSKQNITEKIYSEETDSTTQSVNLSSFKLKNTILKNISSERGRSVPNCNNSEETNEDWWNSNSLQVVGSLSGCLEKEDDASFNSEVLDSNDTVCCCICQEPFGTLNMCLSHSKAHFSDEHYPCTVCKKYFPTESEHTQHCKLHTVTVKKFSPKGKRLKCDLCERRFNSQRTFFNHSCISSDPKQFRCNTCKKSYSTKERLIFHQKFHEGARLNFCEQCGKEFDNEGTLYYHTRMVHEGERPFSCNICGKKFYSNSRLVAHKRVHTGERPFECEVCGRRFYDRDTLKGHYVTHMPVKPFQCDFCGVCWGRKSLLNQHIRTHHSDDNSATRRVPSLIHYYCKICDTTFTNSTDVLMHRTTHWKTSSPDEEVLGSNTHVCEYCGDSFSLVTMLVKHRKQKHPDEKPYVCSLCKVRSHTLYEARLHRNSHSLNKEERTEETKTEKSPTFICEACGNVFTEKRRFMKHMREHKANRSYKCQICGKQFIDNQRLTVHTRLHTGEKPYTCNVCGKKFSQTSALYTHALLHTGEKPHSCDLCGKAFRIKADRDNHRRTHTGEKPYKCEFCGKTFRTGQVYYQHRMIHTGERRFPCNICGKAFKRSHTLVVHKRIHTGEKPNICDICGKGFRQRSDMRKHRALHGSAN